MDHEMCLTWYFVGAKGLGDANLHRNRETLVHFKKVAKMSNFDHKSPSHLARLPRTRTYRHTRVYIKIYARV